MTPQPCQPVRLAPALRVSAAERLVSAPDRIRAARRLVDHASQHGIDLNLLWGTVSHPQLTPRASTNAPFVRQVCLVVPVAGRTAMIFLSPPSGQARFGTPAEQQDERTACLKTALTEIGAGAGTPLVMAQCLIEPAHAWAECSCRAAGMTWVGRLHFMRLPWPTPVTPAPTGDRWPPGITVEPLTDPGDFSPSGDGSALADALEGTYEGTLDCPELRGLRTSRDVIASHMATGKLDPARWWLVRRDGAPEGCCLFNDCPANRAVELVYLGLSPRARGMGLGRRLLDHALSHLGRTDAREITCAVDTRNTPAIRLYRSVGFRPFTARVGFVAPVNSSIAGAGPNRAEAPENAGGSFGTSGGQEKLSRGKRL